MALTCTVYDHSFLNNGDDGGQSHGDDDFRLSLGPLYDKRSSNENYARSSSRLRNSTDPGDYPPMSPIPRRWVEEDTSAYGGIPTKLTPPAYTERRQPGGDSFTSVFNLETHQVLTYLRDRTSLGSDANVEPRLQFRELVGRIVATLFRESSSHNDNKLSHSD